MSRVHVLGPIWVRPMSNMTAISGHTVQMDCPFTGYPYESIVWFKIEIDSNLVKLPQNHRQRAISNGTLVISLVDPLSDQHWYRCLVTSAGHSSAHSDVYLKVLIPPTINPISVPKSLREGMRVVVTCAVLEGSPPIHISWTKEHLKVRANHKMRISSNTDFSQTMFIEEVSEEESGSYQ